MEIVLKETDLVRHFEVGAEVFLNDDFDLRIGSKDNALLFRIRTGSKGHVLRFDTKSRLYDVRFSVGGFTAVVDPQRLSPQLN